MFVHLITHELTVSHTFLCYLNYMRFRKIKCSEEQPLRHPSLSVHTDSVQHLWLQRRSMFLVKSFHSEHSRCTHVFIFFLCRKVKMHKDYSQLLRNADNLRIWIMCHSHYMCVCVCVCSYGPCCNNLREHYWISTRFVVNTYLRNLS